MNNLEKKSKIIINNNLNIIKILIRRTNNTLKIQKKLNKPPNQLILKTKISKENNAFIM